MSARYNEYQQLNLPNIGADILKKWETTQAFEQSVTIREGKQPFVFYEGPPSANGMPGIHHVISRTLKDLVCRYKTMQGFQVKRKGGWDTHGLPVELGVEKELGITKEDIGKKISVEDYNKKCREVVMRYKDLWDDITRKMGYWVDLEHPYVTFENDYIETLWWCLKELYKKGYLYESVSIQPYSPAAGTGLSSHELNQPGTYKDVKDTSATVLFRLMENEKLKIENVKGEVYLMAWTTTPWTLPSNLGLTVGPNIDYVLVKLWNQYANENNLPEWFNGLLAKNLLSKVITEKYFEEVVIKGIYNVDKPNKIDGTKYTADGYFTKNDVEYFIEVKKNLEETKEGLSQLSNLIQNRPNSKGIFYTFEPVNQNIIDQYRDIQFKNYFDDFPILAEFKGIDLEGIRYEQLLPFEANTLKEIQNITPNANPFKIVLGDFVTTEDGTGIVHTAPAFGADDYKAGQKNNLGILTLVDRTGKFLEGVKDGIFLYGNEYVKEDYLNEDEKQAAFQKQKEILEANGKVKDLKKYISVDDRIVLKLQEEGKLFKKEKYEHTYPHCWRTDKPILYYPLDAWFIKTTAAKERMVELNNAINWKPASTGTGRFGNWLENMVDWNLSRSRFWGTPLPIWRTEEGVEEICIGSIEELNAEIKKAAEVLGGEINKHYLHEGILDLHKPYVDDIVLVSPTGKTMKRVPDLIDVWFDSGAMPYAQWGLNKQKLKDKDPFPFGEGHEKPAFPADFIAEGVDQTRGWFYTLHALAVLLFDSVAYKTVVSNGLVLDKNGNKMSKRLGNVVDPFETINKYGADATRWYLITNASPWDSLKFDEAGIQEVQRKFFGTIYNTYQFFALYANVDNFKFSEAYIEPSQRPEIDQWILSSLNSLIKTVEENFDAYEPTQAGRAIEEFVDSHLSNWYVRLCRRRFWKGEYEHDKICAYQTLYECLDTISLLIAPIAPFFAEWLYGNLNETTGRRADTKSVHHALYPTFNKAVINAGLEKRMQLAQDASSLILSLRKKTNIKVRQPLQKVFIPAMDTEMAGNIKLVEEIIKAETNIKEVDILAAENDFIRRKAKANFKTLGKKLGAKMKWAADEIQQFGNAEIEKVQAGPYTLNAAAAAAGEAPIIIAEEDIEISTDEIPGYEIAAKGSLTVALDISISDALKKEGDAREFVNRIQNIRKESNFELTDRIQVSISQNAALQNSLIEFKDYICGEILADTLDFVPSLSDGTQIDVNEVSLKVNVTKK